MKKRSGFVSNSSSSSFCIIGVKIDEEPMDMLKNILKISEEDIFSRMTEKATTATIEDFCERWLEEILEDREGDSWHYLEEMECPIVGNLVGSWEYESAEYNAIEEFDKAKKIVEQFGLSTDDMKIYIGTTCC